MATQSQPPFPLFLLAEPMAEAKLPLHLSFWSSICAPCLVVAKCSTFGMDQVTRLHRDLSPCNWTGVEVKANGCESKKEMRCWRSWLRTEIGSVAQCQSSYITLGGLPPVALTLVATTPNGVILEAPTAHNSRLLSHMALQFATVVW